MDYQQLINKIIQSNFIYGFLSDAEIKELIKIFQQKVNDKTSLADRGAFKTKVRAGVRYIAFKELVGEYNLWPVISRLTRPNLVKEIKKYKSELNAIYVNLLMQGPESYIMDIAGSTEESDAYYRRLKAIEIKLTPSTLERWRKQYREDLKKP